MEYSLIEARSIEALVAVLNVQAGEGWELCGSPVYWPPAVGLPSGAWCAIVGRKARRATDQQR